MVEWAVRNSGDDSSALPYVESDARNTGSDKITNPRSLSESRHQNEIKAEDSSKPTFNSPANGQNAQDKLLQELIDKVKSKNQSIAGCLRGCSVQEVKDGKLVIETKFKFHKEKLEENDAKKLIEDALAEITGKDTVISFVLKL